MLNGTYAMLRFSGTSLVLASVTASVFASGSASAQPVPTATSTTAATTTIAPATGQPQPNRIVNGKNLGLSTRPQNLTPLGISYDDCVSDMTLEFPLVFTGFNGGQLVEAWAGTDCSLQANRGYSQAPTCWPVIPPIAGIVAAVGSPVARRISVRVQDIVAQANSVMKTPTYARAGIAACQTQTVDTAQSITVYFVPTAPNRTDLSGSLSWPYKLDVDLLGPAPPSIPTNAQSTGDTFLMPSWTPNTDPDTIGYDVFIDPIPGQESTAAVGSEPVYVCSEAGAAMTPPDATVSADALAEAAGVADADAAAGDDAGPSDASDDVSVAATMTPDAECVLQFPANSVGAGTGGTCSSSVFSSGASVVVEAGAAVPSTATDASDDVASTSASAPSAAVAGGGISSVDPRYLYRPDSATGITASSITASNYTVTGLKNGVQYTFAIAAVDALGNVGPLSSLQCATPSPVDDFWKKYREAGGQAGGGICSLEAVGSPTGSAVMLAGFVSVAAAAVRRRRRKQR